MIPGKINSCLGAKLLILLAAFAILPYAPGLPAEANGVIVTLEKYNGPTVVHLESVERFKVKITVERKTAARSAYPRSSNFRILGRNLWPFNDVEGAGFGWSSQ